MELRNFLGAIIGDYSEDEVVVTELNVDQKRENNLENKDGVRTDGHVFLEESTSPFTLFWFNEKHWNFWNSPEDNGFICSPGEMETALINIVGMGYAITNLLCKQLIQQPLLLKLDKLDMWKYFKSENLLPVIQLPEIWFASLDLYYKTGDPGQIVNIILSLIIGAVMKGATTGVQSETWEADVGGLYACIKLNGVYVTDFRNVFNHESSLGVQRRYGLTVNAMKKARCYLGTKIDHVGEIGVVIHGGEIVGVRKYTDEGKNFQDFGDLHHRDSLEVALFAKKMEALNAIFDVEVEVDKVQKALEGAVESVLNAVPVQLYITRELEVCILHPLFLPGYALWLAPGNLTSEEYHCSTIYKVECSKYMQYL